jgi:hypothetical protein
MKKVFLLGFIVYLLTAGISYAVFSQRPELIKQGASDTPKADGGKVTNDYEALTFDGPKTEACPLTGELYSKDQRAWWESHRPLGVMIENHLDARPQSGLQAADAVYEAVAEGGITRFLSVYYCQDAGIVGPVRSARTYFMDFISEYGEYPLYAHVGGANTPGPANALGQINDYGWGSYNDLSQFSIGFPTFKRDESRLGREVATEHTMYSVTSKLWEVGEKRGLTNVDKDGVAWDENFTAYSFNETPVKGSGSQTIDISYWNGDDYSVTWTYDPQKNVYLRTNGGVKHMDRNTKTQLHASNVVVLYMTEGRANDGYEGNAHMLYGTKGKGTATVFSGGKEISARWSKPDRQSHLAITDTSGKEVTFNPGKIWFNVQPVGDEVTVR